MTDSRNGWTRRPVLALAAGAFAAAFVKGARAESGFRGEWFGALDLGSRRLRLRLVIMDGPKAELYSIDQGNSAIPASQVTIEGDRIAIAWAVINARYDGQLTAGEIAGRFTQGSTLPLTFSRTSESQAEPAAGPVTQMLLGQLRSECGAPALAAAFLKRGGKRIVMADGLRALGRKEAVTTSDQWHIGSSTKSMTATLLARLVEAGRVAWDDRVGDVLGHAVPGMNAAYRDVTYRHLLCHRSGLAANIDIAELIKFPRESADARADRIAYASLALGVAPAGAKEAHFEYSNSGYVVAGAMLETQLGEPWEALIRKHLFVPLKMKSAGFGAPGKPGLYDQPIGHAANASGLPEPYPPGSPITDNVAALGPAGRVHVSLEDLLTYLAAHCDRSPLLKGASWQLLHTPPFGGTYAMGWDRRGGALWHNGSNTLWYIEMQFDSGSGVVAAAATNDGRPGLPHIAVGKALRSAVAAAS